MKCVAVLHADLRTNGLGGKSRLAAEIGGRPVLRRTVERLERASRLGGVCVLASPNEVEQVRAMLAGTPALVEASERLVAPYRELARSGRAWGQDGWRGGIGGLCWFDEEMSVAACAGAVERAGADSVAFVSAAAALVDPALLDAMIAHHESNAEGSRLTFCQSPPGLTAAIFSRSILEELSAARQPAGALLVYQPDQPQPDLTGKGACYRPASVIIEARGRVIADTRRSFERVDRLIAAGAADWGADRIAAELGREERENTGWPPEEIEIELTTDDPLAGRTILRPRGEILGRRGTISIEHLRGVADAISGWDNVRVVLGGFGEPCLHPRFGEALGLLRGSSAMAIAVQTCGLVGDERLDEALFAAPADAVIVTVDAATPETYLRVHGVDGYEQVCAKIERWARWRIDRRAVRPIIVPEFLKSTANVDDMESFYDSCLRRLGTASIRGASCFAGQFEDRRVTRVTPPGRAACRQARRRVTILADGQVVSCDQDFAGRQVLGRMGEAPLEQIWTTRTRTRLLAAQTDAEAAREFRAGADWPLCASCDEWHRP